ncbi:zinc-dependent metalloprotease [Pseudoalteromonas sp. MMG012]|uniref:zinc-dependent metalloprotease n=1 Tax=Pseudoalteromonas sp. MMG012 TaxID=2822686 RepID=UPI001B3A3790|nr:zinc-dependent metalloprotease [Pseudoalteromonas sp. MMG012]MBQ4849376.1 zinc-dependent metalloprotease [Pseudoalteromonas sp. MMG012]
MQKFRLLPYILCTLLGAMITQAHAAIKSIDEFTDKLNHFPGYYTFFADNNSGKIYLDIDKLKQPFLLQHSLPYGVGSNDIGLDRGQLGGTYMVQFERFGNKVMLRALNSYYQASSDNAAEQQSVKEAFASSILHGFKVVAEDDDSVLVDYTPYLLSDVHGVSRTLAARKQGNFSLDSGRSAVFMPRSKAFVDNTELEALLTFKGNKPGEFVRQVSADPYAITVHQHHSLVKLPDSNYTPRQFHPQSGYWSIEHKDYSAPLGESMYVRYIPRHRLAKKDPMAAVSEPIKPIIYYLDPGVPEPVKTALLDGATWWNDAFIAAGYKNAFRVEILPENADPMDIRYNVIQWVHRATRGWSYGASVIDPRTGEIIKGHVTLGSLRVRQDILIAQALAAPFVKGDEVTERLHAMALDRIRQLSAHEIGHTLGIAHNFSASIKDRASVMDYPHPLVSFNNEGKLDITQGYAKGMGAWDKQVIKYGYSDFTATNEAQGLKAILAENRTQGLEFISDRDARAKGGAHPTAHLWDNGNDPSLELLRVLDVRSQALSTFGINNLQTGEALSQLEEKLVPLYLFHRFQVESAVKLIGGVDYDYEIRGEHPIKGAQVVAKAQQQQALKAMLATLDVKTLQIPESILALLPPKAYGESKTRESVYGRTGLTFDAMALPEVSVNHTLNLLFNTQRLNRVAQQGARTSAAFSLDDLLSQTYGYVFDHRSDTAMSEKLAQRVQYLTAKKLAELSLSDKLDPEVQAQLRFYLAQLVADYTQSGLFNDVSKGDSAFKHYLSEQVQHFLISGKWLGSFKAIKTPPGSPI